jgi:hypothetical protein
MRPLAVPTIVSLLALALISGTVRAQARAPIQPKLGNWEVIQDLTAEQVASIADVPPHVLKRLGYDPVAKTVRTTLCLNKQTMNAWEDQDRKIRESGTAHCADPVYTTAGDTMTMTLECTAPVTFRMRTVYRFSRARDEYEYENEVMIRLDARAVTRSVHGHARRIGDC